MDDPRLYDGAPEEDWSLFPVTYAVPERIPKNEVDAFIAAYPERGLKGIPYETAREKVSAYYFLENERRLKHVTPEERDKYHLELAALEKRVADENDSEDANRVNYRRRKDELTGAMQGPLTKVGAEIAKENSTALVELDRLLSIDENKKKQEDKQKEFEEFVRKTAKEFNRDRE